MPNLRPFVCGKCGETCRVVDTAMPSKGRGGIFFECPTHGEFVRLEDRDELAAWIAGDAATIADAEAPKATT